MAVFDFTNVPLQRLRLPAGPPNLQPVSFCRKAGPKTSMTGRRCWTLCVKAARRMMEQKPWFLWNASTSLLHVFRVFYLSSGWSAETFSFSVSCPIKEEFNCSERPQQDACLSACSSATRPSDHPWRHSPASHGAGHVTFLHGWILLMRNQNRLFHLLMVSLLNVAYYICDDQLFYAVMTNFSSINSRLSLGF